MNDINGKSFFSAWKEAVDKQKETLEKIWREHTNFTFQIKGNVDSVLSGIAQKLDLKCYEKDYYSLDAVFYKEEDLIPDLPKGWCWLRNIQIAFEHENHFNSGLFKEVSHLLITNCEVRVLVTYPNRDNIEDELHKLYSIINGSKLSRKISEEESFLLILGYENGFEWQGYLYSEKAEWRLIT